MKKYEITKTPQGKTPQQLLKQPKAAEPVAGNLIKTQVTIGKNPKVVTTRVEETGTDHYRNGKASNDF